MASDTCEDCEEDEKDNTQQYTGKFGQWRTQDHPWYPEHHGADENAKGIPDWTDHWTVEQEQRERTKGDAQNDCT
jgi:hypothetical protein